MSNYNIPIKNIYYMILYAFDKVKSKHIIDTLDFEEDLTASELFIKLFLNKVSKIIKKGIYKDYNLVNERSIFIKGKIDINKSIRKVDIKKNVIFDEFNTNNDVNKIIKYTLNKIYFSKANKKFKKKIRLIYPYFKNIENITNYDVLYKQIIFNRANINYSFPISLSYFINKNIIPSEDSGKEEFYNILKNEETMWLIFENFLKNFYDIHTDYKVKSGKYNWFLSPLDESNISYLPEMRTDIELEVDDDTKIIIDAKYNKNALNYNYAREKFKPEHMYQLNTYLAHSQEYKNLRGILLYPSVGYRFSQKYERKDKYIIEFHTVDLSKNWQNIESELIEIIK